MTTLFSKIISKELPGVFIHHDEQCVVFMSINPIAPGHALVVPIVEVDHWLDLPVDVSDHLFSVARNIGRAQKRAFSCQRVALVIAGFEVNHCHLHVIPANSMADVSFANAIQHVNPEALHESAELIQKYLD